MMHKSMRTEELEKIKAMTTLETVAYANRLCNRIKCDDCTDEERQKVVELLRQLADRVSFLKITLEPPTFCRLGWKYFAESGEPINRPAH